MDAPTDDSQRSAARLKFKQAKEELARRKGAHAEQLALEAAELDPEFAEVRLWLAGQYEQCGEGRKASRLYQDILHLDREHTCAWEGVKRVDPAAAERLHRLHDIAPDPFVASGRSCPLGEEMADIEGCVLPGEELTAGIPGFGYHPISDDIAGDIEEVSPESPVVCGRGGDPQELFCDIEEEIAGNPAPQSGSPGWEYEQDRPMLERLRAYDLMPRMVAAIKEVWSSIPAMESVLALCAHADQRAHGGLFEAAHGAAAALDAAAPEILLLPERRMDVILLQGTPPTVAVPTGVVRILGPAEQAFELGHALHRARADYLAEWQACEIILSRKTRLPGDCEEMLRDVLANAAGSWRQGLSPEEVERLKKLAHAWQLRACLSSDRAGLIACGDLGMALRTIARSTAPSAEVAATLTAERFLERFAGRDSAELAAIPPSESPTRSEPYAAYRIQMLRWWAGTPEAAGWLVG